MDTRSRLSRALRTPILFCRHANRLYHRRFGRRECNEDGVDPFEADWDNLFILDACRYDMFERRAELPGRLERAESRGVHDRRVSPRERRRPRPQRHRLRDRESTALPAPRVDRCAVRGRRRRLACGRVEQRTRYGAPRNGDRARAPGRRGVPEQAPRRPLHATPLPVRWVRR